MFTYFKLIEWLKSAVKSIWTQQMNFNLPWHSSSAIISKLFLYSLRHRTLQIPDDINNHRGMKHKQFNGFPFVLNSHSCIFAKEVYMNIQNRIRNSWFFREFIMQREQTFIFNFPHPLENARDSFPFSNSTWKYDESVVWSMINNSCELINQSWTGNLKKRSMWTKCFGKLQFTVTARRTEKTRVKKGACFFLCFWFEMETKTIIANENLMARFVV